jgi:hypothetical protein
MNAFFNHRGFVHKNNPPFHHRTGLWAAIVTFCLLSILPARALVINPMYDTSVTSRADAASIMAAFGAAAQFFQNTYSDPVTVNITVSWGTVGDPATVGRSPVTGGAASLFNWTNYNYAPLYTALTNDAKSASDFTSIASGTVGSANPAGANAQYSIPTAEAKALGLAVTRAYPTNTDGWVGFANTTNWNFSLTNRAIAGKDDFVGTAEHEISEVMGRTTQIANTNWPYSLPFDLFRYTGPNTRSFNPTAGGVRFSINNGTNLLTAFNSDPAGGDRSDWATNNPPDAYDYTGGTGSQLGVSQDGITTLDVIGWDLVPEPTSFALLGSSLTGLAIVRIRQRRSRGK